MLLGYGDSTFQLWIQFLVPSLGQGSQTISILDIATCSNNLHGWNFHHSHGHPHFLPGSGRSLSIIHGHDVTHTNLVSSESLNPWFLTITSSPARDMGRLGACSLPRAVSHGSAVRFVMPWHFVFSPEIYNRC